MTVSTEPSTFEFARDWLVSSECLVRDVLAAETVDLDGAREEARERIHREETLDEANEDLRNEGDPDDPPPVANRPRIIVRTVENTRRKVGTAAFAGSGRLAICVEVMVPAEHRDNSDDSGEEKAAKFVSRKEWARQLCDTCRDELHATSGLGEGDRPYLNGTIAGEEIAPNDPEPGEASDWIGWVWDVTWN